MRELGLIIFVVALAAAAVACAPATLADAALGAATEQRLRLCDAQGSVAAGAGTLCDPRGTLRLPLEWRLQPAALARGEIAFVVAPRGERGAPRGRVAVSFGGLAVDGLQIAVPAAALAQVARAPAGVAAGGDVLLSVPTFAANGRDGQGTVALDWTGARAVVAGSAVDLGSVTARLAAKGNALSGPIASSGGALRLAAQLVADDAAIRVNGTLAPAPGAPPDLARALATLGPADASGAVRIAWRATRQ